MAGVVFWVSVCLATLAASAACTDYASDPTIQLFREYLQINTTTHSDLTPAVEFWRMLAALVDLPISVYEYTEGYPVIVITLAGSNSSLSSVMLNSHMDVVPADEKDGWDYGPFDAVMADNGNIYGRGSQDMKSVSIQYFEVLRRLKANNVTLLRDVHMTLMPDEEVGGEHGMQAFLVSDEFAALNVGIEMDEGSSYELPIIPIFYQDKVVWQIQIECYGEAAHSSSFPDTNSTAIGKCNNVMNRFFKFRNEQYEIYKVATVMNAGIYSNVNLNVITGGTANNVIAQIVKMIFDIRPATNASADDFFAQVEKWLEEAGSNITLKYILKDAQSPATVIDETNPYWVALAAAAENLNITIYPLVSPGSTDARFVRGTGIPAFGFSPMPNTPLLLHSVNEYINADTFLKGVNIYEEFIPALANIPANKISSEAGAYVVSTAD